MAEAAPYLLVLITAIVSGATGYLGNVLRNRSAARTAARLVHAELLQNAAGLIYYRESGRLLPPALRRAAWDSNSQALAQLRDATVFTRVSDSYQALEAATFIAEASKDHIPDDLQHVLEDAIARLTTGLLSSGTLAGLPEPALADEARLLAERPAAGSSAALTIFVASSLVLDTRRLQLAAALPAAVGEPAAATWRGAAQPPSRPGRAVLPVRRVVLDARGGEVAGAVVVRGEGDPPTGDIAVDEAYEALGVVHDFFATAFQRDSFDDRGAVLRAVVHYGQNYLNASWDGGQLIMGDGDGKLFHRFTRALDVTAALLAEPLLAEEWKLVRKGQTGALAISLADVIASMVKQYRHQQTVTEADWLIGDGIAARPGMKGLRSLAAPGTAFDDEVMGKDLQPAHMSQYADESGAGAMYLNAGIPSKAFHLTAMSIGGYSWEGAGLIWYDAIRDPRLQPTAGFSAFASATLRAAGRHRDAVRRAWREVGVQSRARLDPKAPAPS